MRQLVTVTTLEDLHLNNLSAVMVATMMMQTKTQRKKGGYNGGHKNMLPELISPGDSGIEDHSESKYEDVLGEEEQIMGDDHFKGTAFFEEYFDMDRNRPGSSKVEERTHKTKRRKRKQRKQTQQN